MTKKDYIKFATLLQKARMRNTNDTINELHKLYVDSALIELIDDLTVMFKQDNPAFDKERFISACEVKKG